MSNRQRQREKRDRHREKRESERETERERETSGVVSLQWWNMQALRCSATNTLTHPVRFLRAANQTSRHGLFFPSPTRPEGDGDCFTRDAPRRAWRRCTSPCPLRFQRLPDLTLREPGLRLQHLVNKAPSSVQHCHDPRNVTSAQFSRHVT